MRGLIKFPARARSEALRVVQEEFASEWEASAFAGVSRSISGITAAAAAGFVRSARTVRVNSIYFRRLVYPAR